MRRLLSGAGGYLTGLARQVARGWDAFFFAPVDPAALGLIRIAVGLLMTWNLAILGLDLRASLGPDGWADPAAVREFFEQRSPWAWSAWSVVPDGLLTAAWGASLAVLVAFTLGLGSRLTAPLAWAIAVSTARRAPVLLFGFDNIVSTWALYLAISGASGRAFALDRLRARRRSCAASGPSVGANLGLRLIQLHLVLIYGAAGLAKLRGEPWWDGTAMEMILLISDFRRFDLTWLAAYPAALALATHVSLALEVGYPVLIWVRPLRPLLLLAVLMMHVGIDLTLGLTEFGLAMIAGNLAFVPGEWLRRPLRPADGPGHA